MSCQVARRELRQSSEPPQVSRTALPMQLRKRHTQSPGPENAFAVLQTHRRKSLGTPHPAKSVAEMLAVAAMSSPVLIEAWKRCHHRDNRVDEKPRNRWL